MYIRVGKTDFPVSLLESQSLAKLKKRFKYLPEKVVEVAYYKVNPKPIEKVKIESKPKKKKSTKKD